MTILFLSKVDCHPVNCKEKIIFIITTVRTWILKKQDVRVLAGLTWLRVRFNGRPL
jgi:hypothetical protein